MWYAVAAAVLVLGGGGSVFFGCRHAVDGIRAMDRFVVPGEHDLQLDAGHTTFFYEPESSIDGVSYSAPESVTGLSCSLTSPAGQSIRLDAPGMTQTYDLAGYRGRSQFAADLERAGTYKLRCAYDSDPGPRVVIAVGEGFRVKAILLFIVGFAASVFLSVPVFLITLIRRRSAARPHYAGR